MFPSLPVSSGAISAKLNPTIIANMTKPTILTMCTPSRVYDQLGLYEKQSATTSPTVKQAKIRKVKVLKPDVFAYYSMK